MEAFLKDFQNLSNELFEAAVTGMPSTVRWKEVNAMLAKHNLKVVSAEAPTYGQVCPLCGSRGDQ